MKAILQPRFGSPDVLEYGDVEKPQPGDDEVLIEVHAASINPMDRHFIRGKPYIIRPMVGFRKPKNPRGGFDVSGVVEAIGKNVTRFKPGDEVFGVCRGAYAEYACTRESALALKPANITFEEAAAVTVAAITALQGLRDTGRVQPGQRVLINGASGGVGTFAVQIAKSLRAHVTGVCSTRNVDLVRSLGADAVIDYTRDDFTRGGEPYDVLFDCIGNHSFSASRRVLKPKGRYVMVGSQVSSWISPFDRLLHALLVSLFVSQKLVPVLAKTKKGDLEILGDLLQAGTIHSVIDRTYNLRDTADAMRYFGEGHARGKVIIRVAA
jgi:NADPH:quinone reductase-like Zn-dependent oxidoreductase